MRINLRSLLVLLLVWVTGASAHACAICAPDNTQTNLVQRLLAADAAVLAGFAVAEADRTIDPIILEVIKGPLPVGAAVRQPVRVVSADRANAVQSVELLLFSGGTWRSVGTLGLERADWARRLLTMSGTDWPKRLEAFAPDLESTEPLVAQTAYEEISIAPYAAMRGIATHLNATRLSAWLNQPALAARRPLYALLLGMSGTPAHAIVLKQHISSMGRSTPMNELSAYLAAYLELRGAAGVPWLERIFLRDAQCPDGKVQAALQALRIHADDGTRLSQERVVRAYALFIEHNPGRAGFVASDLNKWERWEFTDVFVELLKSKSSQIFSSRYAMVFYLMRSPLPQAAAGLEALHAQGVL